ncbi:S1-C subfamily serine protease [Rhodopirellula rubra]|uniref:S1-C subfamily serine protease n=1 Tax=Aporhodopirellula rubra TaxID=980271 RepID=A0A7W5E0T8_9BACT|nr:trypsin-like peptidase domain-containing protein [Aporhodopirellula rubra]MBB3207679.1 S1-C subfamily serine protease [Aporhodopirellula rubra]
MILDSSPEPIRPVEAVAIEHTASKRGHRGGPLRVAIVVCCAASISWLHSPTISFAQTQFFQNGQPLPGGTVVPGTVLPGEVLPGDVVRGNVRGNIIQGNVIQGDVIQGTVTPGSSSSERVASPMASTAEERDASNAPGFRPKGDTWVKPPDALVELLDQGGVPDSLETMRLLQRQQQLVAARAAECTVSVQIGPAQGCGVIITESGYVLTAAHVAMRPGKNAVLTLADGRTVTATTRGMNRHVDAGLMKINDGQNGGKPWPFASPGTSENLRSGMWCIATGHPGGYDRERGMVTRVGRILDVREDSLVTDCALIGGDSGGPLFDLSGRLIAVHSRIGNEVTDNLHVPVDHYRDSWDRMNQGESWGYLPGFKPVLGVRGNASDPEANVKVINPGSPADEAGIESGDVVERFGDVQITDFESLKAAVSDTMPGERVKVWVRREGRLIQVVVEIGRANDQ